MVHVLMGLLFMRADQKKRQTHPAQWDGLEGNGATPSVIFADAEIQKYIHPRMEPRIREVDQGMGTRVLACLSSFLPLRSLRLGGKNVFVLYHFLGRCPRLVVPAPSGHKCPIY